MRSTTLFTVVYVFLALVGMAVLSSAIDVDDSIGVTLGLGGVILGILGYEAQDIKERIRKDNAGGN